jgi:hypothetical protein
LVPPGHYLNFQGKQYSAYWVPVWSATDGQEYKCDNNGDCTDQLLIQWSQDVQTIDEMVGDCTYGVTFGYRDEGD